MATLLGKSAELVVAALAIWRLGAIQVPLFTAFAPPAIAMRIVGNGTKVVITEPAQRPKLDELRADADEIAPRGERGRIAVDLTASPLMWFTGYRDAPDRTADRFTSDGRWYLTGDTGAVDPDGFVHFAARDDDVILMAGYRIGPFEVESVLVQHGEVAEAAVVGVPDELRGELLVAYVVLKPGGRPSDDLALDLQNLVKKRYAAHAYPRRIHFVTELPKTPSGKIQRFLLRG